MEMFPEMERIRDDFPPPFSKGKVKKAMDKGKYPVHGEEKDLNLSIDHCKYKNAMFAVLELVGNAVDANVGSRNLPRVAYNVDGNLVIEDDGDGVRVEDFKMGQTGGVEGETIGSFGIGLLDSVAILARLGARFEAHAYNVKYTFPVKGSDVYLRTEYTEECYTGTRWVIGGCPDISHHILSAAKIKSWFLCFQPHRTPFVSTKKLDVYHPSWNIQGCKVFVNGRRMEGFKPTLFVYNFTDQDLINYGREHQIQGSMTPKLVGIIDRTMKANRDMFLSAYTLCQSPDSINTKYYDLTFSGMVAIIGEYSMHGSLQFPLLPSISSAEDIHTGPNLSPINKRHTERRPPPQVQVKGKKKSEATAEVLKYAIVDYNAARDSHYSMQDLRAICGKDVRLLLIGTNPPPELRVKKGNKAVKIFNVPDDVPQLVFTIATEYNKLGAHEVTIYCRQEIASSLRSLWKTNNLRGEIRQIGRSRDDLSTNPFASTLPPTTMSASGAPTCVICMEAPRDTLLRPCNMLVTCQSCTDEIDDCPICRELIEDTIPIIIS